MKSNDLNKFIPFYSILCHFIPFYCIFLALTDSMHAHARIENLKFFIFGKGE